MVILDFRTVAGGAGFAGDRIEPAVEFASTGAINAIGLECLAERTLVPGLRARRLDPKAGADVRLKRRLKPLIVPAKKNNCRVISNLGAANPIAGGTQVVNLARELDCKGLAVASVVGDDVRHLEEKIDWVKKIEGELLGAHAYLGADALEEGVLGEADVIITGRVADSALFSAELLPILNDNRNALAGATTVGHLLECSGQITGGNFEMPDGSSLSALEFSELGFPIAKVFSDGSAEVHLMDGAKGRIDTLTCTLQLLYEVHDPSCYITPDAILDFTTVEFVEVGKNRVHVSNAAWKGRPNRLKVSGFIDQPGFIADIEIGYAGTHSLNRAKISADALRRRLNDIADENVRIDLVGIDSTLGAASVSPANWTSEVRVHASVRCEDAEMAQSIEDEVYSLTLSGPAGGGSVRSERRANMVVADGFIDRELVSFETVWEKS